MALDAYSMCPGGYPKRIKFCCKDLLPELQQLDRMVEGEQNLAALERVEGILSEKPDRACLMETRAQLLEVLERVDDWVAAAKEFAEKHPASPVAHAEWALALCEDADADVKLAVGALQDAFDHAEEGVSNRVYQAMGAVAQTLVHEGFPLAARALWSAQVAVYRENREPIQYAMQVLAAPQLSVIAKDDRPFKHLPPGSPSTEAFDKAMAMFPRLRWRQAGQRFMELGRTAPDEPAVWYNLATVLIWLAENESAQEALRQYAALDVPEDDAAESEALAMLLDADPLGDQVELYHWDWDIDDVDEVQRRLSSPRLQALDSEMFRNEGTVPPKAVFALLDRAPAADANDYSLAALPRVIGALSLFGRQTDQPAQVRVSGSSHQEAAICAFLGDLLGDALPGEPKRTQGGIANRTLELFRTDWQFPRDTVDAKRVAESLPRLKAEVLLQQWPHLPLGALDGKTPQEAAADDQLSLRLQAVLMVLESQIEDLPEEAFTQLRAALGVPQPAPIAASSFSIADLPPVRLERLDVPGMTDAQVVDAFRKAVTYRASRAIKHLAVELVGRPGIQAEAEVMLAYQFLVQSTRDKEQAIAYLQELRKRDRGKACIDLDFLEIDLRLQAQQFEDFRRLVVHIEQQHRQDRNAMTRLMQLMVRLGLLNPDGTPAVPVEPEAAGIVVPGAEAEAGKLWTPDSPAAGGGQAGKIWLPD